MTDSTVKEKILQTLLVSISKTTGDIAIELGYVDTNGYGKYKNIKSDLNTLSQYGFIHGFKQKEKKPGAPATTYEIVYKLPVIKKILEKYPDLVSDLQKNEIILSMLVEKHRKLLYPFQVGEPKKDELKEYELCLLPEYIEDFKDDLATSPTLFKKCISHESEKITSVLRALMDNLDLIEYVGFSKMCLIEHQNKNRNTPAELFYYVCRVFDRLNES